MLRLYTPLSTALEKHPTLIPLVGRFGVRLGHGEQTIEQVCHNHDIDPVFMLTLMNTFLFEDYFPEKRFKEFHIGLISDYLCKTAEYYRKSQLPNIERHLGVLVRSAGTGNTDLSLIEKFFNDLRTQILSYDGLQDESQITDLISIMIRHLTGQYDDNLAYAVIFALSSLAHDVGQNNRIRNRIIERNSTITTEVMVNSDELSQREIQVLTLVVSGSINKEIAARLNISINTVLTHRKNITAKLGIKTVSGLTLYALMHGYIKSN